MKQLFLSQVFFTTIHLFAQYDTSLITRAFSYVKTHEFKVALKAYTENKFELDIKLHPGLKKRLKSYRKQEESKMNFWIIDRCFVPDSFYYVPDLSTRIINSVDHTDSLFFKKYNKIIYKKPDSDCIGFIAIQPYLLDSRTIQLEHFDGQYVRGIRFGEANVLILKEDSDKFQVLFRGDINWN